MRNWKLDPTNGFRTRKKSNGAKYYFFRYISINNTDSYIIIDISDKRIVKFSKTIVDEWPDEDVNMFHIRKYFIWKIDSKGSRAIMKITPLFFYPEKDFSKIFYTFARSFVEHKIAPQQDDTVSIYDFYNNFVKVSVFDPIDFEILIRKTEGYIFFHLSENNNTKKRLDTLTLKSGKYFILGATYISPFACSLVECRKVNVACNSELCSINPNPYHSKCWNADRLFICID